MYMAIKCKPCGEITVESGTHLKTVHICSLPSLHDFLGNHGKEEIPRLTQ